MRAIHRRTFLRTSAAGALFLSAPTILRAQSGDPVKIGVSMPTQGVFALHGEAGRQGIDIALAQHGGTVLGGRPVQLIHADESTPLEAQQNVTKLIEEERVSAIIGGSNSGPGLAIQSVVAQAGIPAVITGATGKDITGKACNPYTFRVNAPGTAYARLLTRFLLKDASVGKNWYFVYGAYASGQDAYTTEKAELLAAGGTEVGSDAMPVGTSDFSSIILKIRQTGPDYVILAIGGNDLASFLKQYSEFGMRDRIPIAAATIDDFELWSQTDPVGIYGKFWHFNDPANTPEEMAMNEAVVNLAGHPATQAHANAWAGMRMLLAAIDTANSLDASAFIEAMGTARPQGVRGRFRDWDHQFIAPLVLGKVRDNVTDKYDVMEIVYSPATLDEAETLYDTQEQSECRMPTM